MAFGTCATCNHVKASHPEGKACKVLGCKCDKFKPKGLLQR